MPGILADSLNVSTSGVNRFAQTGAVVGVAIEASGWNPNADQWNRILSELDNIRNLQDDWDGLGAKAPSAPLVESAVEMARILRAVGSAPPTSVVTGPDGTVLFNWQDELVYLDAEVTRPYFVEWMQVIPGQLARHWVTEHFNRLYPEWNSWASYQRFAPW